MSSGFGCARRAFIKNSLLAAVSASLSLPLLDSVSAQTNTVLAIPKAVTTPDMSTGEWLPNEFPKENSLELITGPPFNGIPSNATLLPYIRLNHDADYVYVLTDLVRETTLQNDVFCGYALDTANNGRGLGETPANFFINFGLQGSGSSPTDYKISITTMFNFPDASKVKGNFSFATTDANPEKHVIIKQALPRSTIEKYQHSYIPNNTSFGLEAELGNTSATAHWPINSTSAHPYGQLYLSDETTVDFLPRGIGIGELVGSIAFAKLLDSGRKFHRRKYDRILK